MAAVSMRRWDANGGWPGSLPSATNFVSFDTGAPARAKALVAALAAHDAFIRTPGATAADRCIRVTVGTAEERAAFAEMLRAVLPTLPEQVERRAPALTNNDVLLATSGVVVRITSGHTIRNAFQQRRRCHLATHRGASEDVEGEGFFVDDNYRYIP